jgi:hypothetical protein
MSEDLGASPSGDRAAGLRPQPQAASQSSIPSALLELAARCEAAEGPDRELDIEICRMLYREAGVNVSDDFRPDADEYTASLDDAMGLVPEGWPRTVTDNQGLLGMGGYAAVTANPAGEIVKFTSQAATPALALCAAALKARAAQGMPSEGPRREGGSGASAPASPVGKADAPEGEA